MENAPEVLVVILSAFLAVFLLLGIALLIALLRLTRALRDIAERAGSVIGSVDSAAHIFKNAAGPLAIGKFLVNLAETVVSKRKGKD